MGDFDVDALTAVAVPRGIAIRDTLTPLECLLYDVVWPVGSLASGTATAANETTMTDAGATFGAGQQYRGLWVKCVATGQIRDIASHTGTVLTLFTGQEWSQASQDELGAGGDYEIGPTGPVESLSLVGSAFGMLNVQTDEIVQVRTTLGYLVAGAEGADDPLGEVEQDCEYDATHHQ